MKGKGSKMSKIVNTTDPYAVTWVWGEPVDRRTASFLQWVERKSGVPVRVVQGSYQKKYGGGAAASAGTHDGGGVVDLSISGLSRKQRVRLMRYIKRGGGFAWYRRGPGWVGTEHIHAGLRKHRNLAAGAAQQERDYDNRRNGLVSNLPDKTWRPKKPRRWSHRRNKPIVGK